MPLPPPPPPGKGGAPPPPPPPGEKVSSNTMHSRLPMFFVAWQVHIGQPFSLAASTFWGFNFALSVVYQS
jgi:hypothetical protein